MLDLFMKHRAAVICSIIASILCVYFLEPILSFLGHAFLSSASFLSAAYTNRIYAQAAHLETLEYGFLLVLILVLIPIFIFQCGLALFGYRLFRKEAASNRTEDIEERAKSVTNDTDHVELDQSQRVGLSFIQRRVVGVAVLLFCAISLMWGVSIAGGHWVQLSLISSFRQHVRVLKPYIDYATEEQIISDWSRMSSKADYNKIQDQLIKIAEQNGIQLPQNKLYSAFSI